jgi:hypothetical protein
MPVVASTDSGRVPSEWPSLVLDEWLPTYATLHRWVQIVGKTRLALSPFQNHWWHSTLYVTVRGLSTSPMPIGSDGSLDIEFDFLHDRLLMQTSDGRTQALVLQNKSVAEFYSQYRSALRALDVDVRIYPVPNEIPDATPFADDHEHRTYDGEAARRCWGALTRADRALKEFRGGFAGKSSPSHFWWGAFDLACTRFSGRTAPLHPGGIPNCPAYVMREAYSHECISAGWWPGAAGSAVTSPAFYAYAYPQPPGLDVAPIRPSAARYDLTFGEWILPYDDVRTASDPSAMVAEFLESTYETAAELGKWDVAALRSARDTLRRAIKTPPNSSTTIVEA